MKHLIISLLATVSFVSLNGQAVKKEIRSGNRYFNSEKYSESETAYRKALAQESRNNMASFNLGDALFRQEKYDEAATHFETSASREIDKTNSAKAYHNLGNAQLMAGKIDESINAYKEALRKNPGDLDTKYNLTYAMNLKKQQQQQQQQQQKDQNGDENKDQNQNQEQKDQQSKQDQQKDNQQNQQQAQQQPVKISKEDAKRLLEALANDEKKVQDKVKKEKAAAARTRSIKDW
jgi:tetratricopeptide (TPR) repeat protein